MHYKAEVLLAHLAHRTQPRITISDERGAIARYRRRRRPGAPLLGDAPFLIHNSDTVWIERGVANIDRLIAAWDAERMDSLLLLADARRSIGYDGAAIS